MNTKRSNWPPYPIPKMQLGELLSSASKQLYSISDSPRLDAQVLLAQCLSKSRTWLATWPDKIISSTQAEQFSHLLERRLNGEPIAHITGHREFWSLDILVNKHTLIPRPDTELLIEQVLLNTPLDSCIQLLDLGTGSGAIALALASERPKWQIIASDQSSAALQMAKKNAQQLNLTNIQFYQGSWFGPIKQLKFDIIACNPPYIPSDDPHLSQGDVRFEPLSALASGRDGLDDIRLIVDQARQHLKPNGRLIIEHGYDQKEQLMHIFKNSCYKNITQHLDLSGNPRLTSGLITY